MTGKKLDPARWAPGEGPVSSSAAASDDSSRIARNAARPQARPRWREPANEAERIAAERARRQWEDPERWEAIIAQAIAALDYLVEGYVVLPEGLDPDEAENYYQMCRNLILADASRRVH